MIEAERPYSKSKTILDNKFITLAVYYMKPSGREPKHFHRGTEWVYVLDGNCTTHEKGQLYKYEEGEVHEFNNDSPNEVVLAVLTIPQDTPVNTIYA